MINAVEMVRKIRDENYDKTKNMNPEEKIKYIKSKANELQKYLINNSTESAQNKNITENL